MARKGFLSHVFVPTTIPYLDPLCCILPDYRLHILFRSDGKYTVHLFPVLISMKKFFRHILVFFIPFFGMLVWYLVEDPFMVVRFYDDYFPSNSRRFCSNDAFRGIRLLDLYSDSIRYNAFILGSSRSDFYYAKDWQIATGKSLRCFHFNQSGDNLLGMVQRINYLYRRFEQIDDMLLIMDHEFLSDIEPKEGPLFREPYQVTEMRDFVSFHWSFLRTFYSVDFQRRYWSEGGNRSFGEGEYDAFSNELHKSNAEISIEKAPEKYYKSLPVGYQLYPRDSVQKIAPIILGEEQKSLLVTLANLLDTHHTDYRIIISPLYDQVKLNPSDSLYLSSIFSPKRFFDFSGINRFTSDTLNYYENSHYRPILCRQLLGIVYSN